MRAGNRAHHCEMVWSQAVKKSLVRFHASGRRLPSEGECLASPGEWSLLSFRMFIKQRSQRQFWIPPASGKLAMESILPNLIVRIIAYRKEHPREWPFYNALNGC